jgi:eukaryotic-like serine/threonine-protein kinase
MEFLVGFMPFITAIFIVNRVMDARSEQKKRDHEAKMAGLGDGGAGGASLKELNAMRSERKLLVERIENLESIVCSVDYELNQKVSRLLEEQRSLLLPQTPMLVPQKEGAGPAAVAAAATADGGAVDAHAVTAPPATGPSGGGRATAGTSPTLTASPAGKRAPAGAAAHPEHGSELRNGSVIANRYRVQRLLGRGGMGAVYLCDDEVLGDLVALKVISSAWAADEAAMTERFKREAQAARRVSSPSVIRIHDLGEAPPRLLYLSMEYFPGRTLSQVITQRGVVPLSDCKDYLSQICDGLAAAHDAGVVHRDLKPGNVLVGERNAIKVIDFGLAKATAVEGLTATGALLGTPHYMAPEQIRGKNVDARADIYSLGALAFHLLSGRPPFGGDNAIAVGFAHLSETPPALRTLRPEIPEALEQMVARALAKEASDRPTDARNFREALR